MKSLQRRFKAIQEKNPYLGSYARFAEAVKNQNFSKKIIRRWFPKLIDKDDYEQKDKMILLRNLYKL